jgi:Neurochondrin
MDNIPAEEPSGPKIVENLDEAPSLGKIQELLQTKNDTSRFVGLALLKSVLDNSPTLREDDQAVLQLWDSISPKFLDRLIKTGQREKKDMLDLAISVIHIFAMLLPEDAKRHPKLTGRIPPLVGAVLNRSDLRFSILREPLSHALRSSPASTRLILQTLHTIASFREGAIAFVAVEDLSPLTEIAPKYPETLDIFSFAWLNSMGSNGTETALKLSIDKNIQQLVSSFKGTDAVTLLNFLSYFLRNTDPEVIPRDL